MAAGGIARAPTHVLESVAPRPRLPRDRLGVLVTVPMLEELARAGLVACREFAWPAAVGQGYSFRLQPEDAMAFAVIDNVPDHAQLLLEWDLRPDGDVPIVYVQSGEPPLPFVVGATAAPWIDVQTMGRPAAATAAAATAAAAASFRVRYFMMPWGWWHALRLALGAAADAADMPCGIYCTNGDTRLHFHDDFAAAADDRAASDLRVAAMTEAQLESRRARLVLLPACCPRLGPLPVIRAPWTTKKPLIRGSWRTARVRGPSVDLHRLLRDVRADLVTALWAVGSGGAPRVFLGDTRMVGNLWEDARDDAADGGGALDDGSGGDAACLYRTAPWFQLPVGQTRVRIEGAAQVWAEGLTLDYFAREDQERFARVLRDPATGAPCYIAERNRLFVPSEHPLGALEADADADADEVPF